MSPGRPMAAQTKEERVLRHRKFLETQKGDMPLRTIRVDKETQRTHRSQFEEGEELVQVIDENLLDEKQREQLDKHRDAMRQARQQYEKDLLGPLQSQKLSEERIKELKDRLVELRKDHDLRNLEKEKDEAAKMVKDAHERFQVAWPEYQRKQLEMEKTREEMNKKYVEMHLMYNKYLIDEDRETGTLGGARANLLQFLQQNDDQNQAPAAGGLEDWSRQLEEVKREQQARIDNLPRIESVFGRKGAQAPKVYSEIRGTVAADAWTRSREAHHHKLRKYREQKDYQRFIEEDEEDIEGEQIYSSIKNLHAEKFYQHYFYEDVHRDASTAMANMDQLEGVKAMEETLKADKPFLNDTFGALP